jgi:hypothetical protein
MRCFLYFAYSTSNHDQKPKAYLEDKRTIIITIRIGKMYEWNGSAEIELF